MRSLQVVLLCILCTAQLNARTELLKDNNSLDDASSDTAASVGARTYDGEDEVDDDSAEYFFYNNALSLESHKAHARLRRGTSLLAKNRLRVMTFNIENYKTFVKSPTRNAAIIKVCR